MIDVDDPADDDAQRQPDEDLLGEREPASSGRSVRHAGSCVAT
jgi:hypothetical protein